MTTLTSYSTTDIKRTYSATEYAKGEQYVHLGKVLSTTLDDTTNTITGKVQGSQRTPYTVLVQPYSNKGNTRFRSQCSCPLEWHCKHVVATLLYVLKEKQKTNTSGLNWEINEWLDAIGGTLQEKKSEETTQNSTSVITYILRKNNDSLYVEFNNVKIKKNGEYSQANPSLVSLTKLLDSRSISSKLYLQNNDWEIMTSLLRELPSTSRYLDEIRLNTGNCANIVQKMVQTGRCHWKEPANRALEWGEPREGELIWQVDPQNMHSLQCVTKEESSYIFSDLNPLCYIDIVKNICGFIELPGFDARTSRALLKAPKISSAQVPTLKNTLTTRFPTLALAPPKELEMVFVGGIKPKIHFKVWCEKVFSKSSYEATYSERVVGQLSFNYNGHILPPEYDYKKASPTTTLQDKTRLVRLERDIKTEEQAIQDLMHIEWAIYDDSIKFTLNNSHFLLTESDDEYYQNILRNFYLEDIPYLRQLNWTVEIDASYPFQAVDEPEEWYAHVEEESVAQWFNLEVGVIIDGEKINLLPLILKALPFLVDENGQLMFPDEEDAKVFIPIKGNKHLPIPATRLRALLGPLLELYSTQSKDKEGKISLSYAQAGQLAELNDALAGVNTRWHGGERLKELGQKLKEFTHIEKAVIPETLNCSLRPYQLDGVSWLQFLRAHNLNGVLADDMGLGKTVQAITHLVIEKESGRMDKPALVVAPTSLMHNWHSEATRFAPGLKTLVLHGTARKEHFEKLKDYDLILTTYPLLFRDKEQLLKQEYHILILDEAQVIKNHKTKAHLVVQQLTARHRMCLTGTPMENHLGELWSLFHFLQPGLLGDQKRFTQLFRTPIEKHGSRERREVLTKRIKPFMLRRTKQQVAAELPEKTVIIQKIDLSNAQRDLYESIRLTMHAKVKKEIEQKGLQRSHITILDALLKLRQVCCDPRLLKLAAAKKVTESSKLEYLKEMLPELIEQKRQILLFSQFTSMLTLIEEMLTEQKISYVKLTGETLDRKTPIEVFQAGEVPLFLISLKAGGTGLNLTAADTVIHYDPWWNPAVENQATDRAHRIGQTKVVFVYKLVTSGTVEEKIIEMQKRKAKLMEGVIGKEQELDTMLSQMDLEALFEPLE